MFLVLEQGTEDTRKPTEKETFNEIKWNILCRDHGNTFNELLTIPNNCCHNVRNINTRSANTYSRIWLFSNLIHVYFVTENWIHIIFKKLQWKIVCVFMFQGDLTPIRLPSSWISPTHFVFQADDGSLSILNTSKNFTISILVTNHTLVSNTHYF